MTTQNSINAILTALADGWEMSMGTILRKLKITGADITLTGSGSNTHTFPATSSTLLSNQAAEISALTEKTVLHANDLHVIEDSEDGNAKKKVKHSNMGGGGGLTVAKQVFTANGTYTPTSGMIYCIIEAVGGGGGGGGCLGNSSGFYSGASGGGGGYSKGLHTAADIGASKAVTIGAAGTGASAGANTGGDGGDTSVGTLVIAKGGKGGTGGSASVGPTAVAGGVAGTGNMVNSPGWPGGPGIYSTTPIYIAVNKGADSHFGAGAPAPSPFGPGNGIAGSGYGSGGSGGFQDHSSSSSRSGGAGTAGLVVITEFI